MLSTLLFVVVAASPLTALEQPPSKQTVVFYNARLALREKRPTDVLKLWLLRNSLVQQGELGREDGEFRSLVWAALGALGLCQDGFPWDDEGGAGLWPLAFHNWVVQTMNRGPAPESLPPFPAFEVSRQQRFVSLSDVLSDGELRSVSFFRTDCLLPSISLLQQGRVPWMDWTDRLATGTFLRRLLVRSLETLDRRKLQNVAAVEARIFDLDLTLAGLQARRARRDGSVAQQRARGVGVSSAGSQEARDAAAQWPESSEQAKFLRKSLAWSTAEWLTLSRERRLFLYAQARPFAQDNGDRERRVLAMIDALAERGEGAEVESWIGHLELGKEPLRRGVLTQGERGKGLLEMEPEKGFRERAVIALHRGVAFLEAGERQEALRSFAFAMAHAEESRESSAVLALGRRWLSYVLARYETDEEVIATLKALVPKQEYNAVVEDLVWKAALRVDARSFDRLVGTTRRGGTFEALAARLRLLAQGKSGELLTQLRDTTATEPYFTLRFIRQFLEKMEAEDLDVRHANAPLLKRIPPLLDSLAGNTQNKAHQRAAEELSARVQAVLEGLRHLDVSTAGKARTLSVHHEAFAGNIRLAPADPLPWPFRAPEMESPSAFLPLVLEPREWTDARGKLVFGWRITE